MTITMTITPLERAIWDIAIDYDAAAREFYARSDIDRRVFIPLPQSIWVNPNTGERKTNWRHWSP